VIATLVVLPSLLFVRLGDDAVTPSRGHHAAISRPSRGHHAAITRPSRGHHGQAAGSTRFAIVRAGPSALCGIDSVSRSRISINGAER
jgi:hypothetical protein